MAYSAADLYKALDSIYNEACTSIPSLIEEFDDYEDWLDRVKDMVRDGNLAGNVLFPKTPGKKRGALGTINESLSIESKPDGLSEPVTVEKKQPSRKVSKQPQSKRKQDSSSNDEEETVCQDSDSDSVSKRRKTKESDEGPPVISITDATIDVSNITRDASPPTRNENQRLTRSMIERTTVVRETRETFVIERSDQVSHNNVSPVLQSQSPLSNPEFKTPPPVLKPIAPIHKRDVSPMEIEVTAPVRMTRTKTRAMAKAAKKETPESPSSAEKSLEKDSEQENETTSSSAASHVSRTGIPSFVKQKVGTPLGKINILSHSQVGTPSSGNLITSVQSLISKPAPASVKKDRHEEYLLKLTQKTNEASKKREEMIKAQTEEKMRKRQEKVSKVNAAREAIEKERAEKLRLQMALEEQKQKQELAKRRKLALQKAAEAAEAAAKQAKRLQEEEQRRLLEERKREQEELKRLAEERKREQEQLRLAEERKKEEEERRRLLDEKRRELEEKKRLAEEQKRIAEEQKRLAEEQKRLAEDRKRLQEEMERKKKEAEKAVAMKAKAAFATAKVQLDKTFDKPMDETYTKLDETYVKPTDSTFVKPSSYDMTPAPEDRKPAPAKSLEDYGIDEAECDDSSDDESNPKKEVPAWALSKNRMPHLKRQYFINHRQRADFFGSKKSTPDLSKIFQKIDKRLLIRKSSAVWRTPPIKFNDSML